MTNTRNEMPVIKRQFIFHKYEDFTEEEKILYLQEGDDGVHNQIAEKGGKLIDFDLYIYMYDKDFYNKYKLLFVDEVELRKKLIIKKMLEESRYYIDTQVRSYFENTTTK